MLLCSMSYDDLRTTHEGRDFKENKVLIKILIVTCLCLIEGRDFKENKVSLWSPTILSEWHLMIKVGTLRRIRYRYDHPPIMVSIVTYIIDCRRQGL